MATIHAVVLPKDKKKDDTWNVKYRISHKSEDRYIKTEHYIKKWQLTKSFEIKDPFILDRVNPVVKRYRDIISTMKDIDFISSSEIKARLLKAVSDDHKNSNDTNDIDFLEFCNNYINENKKAGKAVATLTTVVNSLKDYFKTNKIYISDINYKFLLRYEAFLRSPRQMLRNNHSGYTRTYTQKPIGDAGLHNHMRDLRLLFNKAKDYFNDEDTGEIRIVHYPFKKYKVGHAPLTEHRDRTIAEMRKIKKAKFPSGSRAELARDLFMLSFYLCGMNAADIYEIPEKFKDRINYNRAKTKGKRRDNAFISVKIVKPAIPLLKKYAGQLQKRYSAKSGLLTALDKGLQEVSRITDIPDIDFYDARHTFGTWARNKCGFSFDDVATALNQRERTVTDIYVAPDWSIVDKVQAGVISLL